MLGYASGLPSINTFSFGYSLYKRYDPTSKLLNIGPRILFAIKKFKQLVANYFAKAAIEKQKRKLEKAKLKFQVFSSDVSEKTDKILKYKAALETLATVLGVI